MYHDATSGYMPGAHPAPPGKLLALLNCKVHDSSKAQQRQALAVTGCACLLRLTVLNERCSPFYCHRSSVSVIGRDSATK